MKKRRVGEEIAGTNLIRCHIVFNFFIFVVDFLQISREIILAGRRLCHWILIFSEALNYEKN